MSGPKKFGTFAGVFTPALLTILGVIMYMRLGWVAGNAGLITTLGIILLAHIISVATGLSISSIATDKKVGAGGVYYVLSRSLGLPIGGALGIALFVATAFSIALYMVGFGEIFNEYIQFGVSYNEAGEILHNPNALRITGSLGLLALTIIAFISTSIALKSQYIILGAIGLSLVSIFMGDPDKVAGVNEAVGSVVQNPTIGFAAIFAIFFPAVTGFTAGVAMSGDLKDPKKSIPRGTMGAIFVGLIIYTALAVFLIYSFEPSVLINNPKAMFVMAWFPILVYIGVWGATLSSALGGILGGPRILQAMSVDKITPKLFARGVGKGNEPRNALVLTVIIAEAGILIGDLNVIAEIVSMFYLTAYGFINISFFLESWASPDFKPTFKVKKWVGLIGFIATIGIMSQLNMMAMIAAFILIGLIYLYLQRRQVSLGTGDIWHSVWNSVVKRGLRKLEGKDDHLRNWKPNILLFSGGTNQRPHLLEFSRAISGKDGMVTNFDLIENTEATVLFPKHKQAIKDPLLDTYGIFGRRIEVQNVFKGIENIASTFGFSGVEPNTILMGWAKNTKDPLWFAQMTNHLINLDYNVLYLDYDERFGFGRHEQIDIWWRNLYEETELTLNIAKYLTHSDDWRNSSIRIILVNDNLQEGLERKIQAKLDEYRVIAEIKVIQNAVEQRAYYDLMKSVSDGADLIISTIPEIQEGSEREFVNSTNEMFAVITTCLMVKSSSKLNLENLHTEGNATLDYTVDFESNLSEIYYPIDPALKTAVEKLNQNLVAIIADINANELRSFKNNFASQILIAKEILEKGFEGTLENSANKMAIQRKMIRDFGDKITEFKNDDLQYLAERLDHLSNKFISNLRDIIEETPFIIKRPIHKEDILINASDTKLETKAKKRKKRAFLLRSKATIAVPLQNIVSYHFNVTALNKFQSFQNKLGLVTYTLQNEISNTFIDAIRRIENFNKDQQETSKALSQKLIAIEELVLNQQKYLETYLVELGTYVTNSVSLDAKQVSAPDLGRKMRNFTTEFKHTLTAIKNQEKYWLSNQSKVSDQVLLDLSLNEVGYSIKNIAGIINTEVESSIYKKSQDLLEKCLKQVHSIKKLVENGQMEEASEIDIEKDFIFEYDQVTLSTSLADLQDLVNLLPEKIEAFTEKSKNDFAFKQGAEVESFEVDIALISDFIIDKQIQEPLEIELQNIAQTFKLILDKAINNLRLLSFSLHNRIDGENKLAIVNGAIIKAEEGLNQGLKEFEKKKSVSVEKLDHIFYSAIGNLSATFIIDQATELEAKSLHGTKKSNFNKWSTNQVNYFRLKWNKFYELLTAKKEDLHYSGFRAKNKSNDNLNAKLHGFVENNTPSKAVLSDLPFYYQQLFTGKHSPKMEFLNNRENELKQAELAYERIRNGANGGILILGNSLSGKTFFSEMAAKINGNIKTIKIEPPIDGTHKKTEFFRTLNRQFGNRLQSIDAIKDAPKGATIIFDDVELWWERSRQGNEVIQLILELIQKYSKDYFIIVNCNTSAFKLLNKINSFQNYFIDSIQMSPFQYNAMHETLLERHKAAGMDFSINDVDEADLSEKEIRKFIEEIHTKSLGNIGEALHLWQAAIKAIDKNKIVLSSPAKLDFPIIEDKEFLVILAQFVIHKHMSANKLRRVFDLESKQEADRMLEKIIRSGLVEQLIGNTYRIKPYVARIIVEALHNYELI